MLDRHLVPRLKRPLAAMARRCDDHGFGADQITVIGFGFGMASIIAIANELTIAGLILLLLNRLADGIDGELARRGGSTDAGAFIDISLDFIFYAAFPLGFAIADPASNALPAAVLIASFVGTGASFLAFAAQADRYGIAHPDFGYKGLYYLDGLAEGTETILCFVLMCLLPEHFAVIAWVFAAICLLTAANRVVSGYLTLKAKKPGTGNGSDG